MQAQPTRLLTYRSLLLNSSYEPMKVVSWQKAILLWFQGKVEIIEFHSIFARSVRSSFQVPSVMRLKTYVRPRSYGAIRFCRENVYIRDNFTCQECGVRSGNGKAVYLEAHHCRISFSEIMNKYKITTIEEAVLCPELWDINNGLTLCVPCHDKTKKGRPHG